MKKGVEQNSAKCWAALFLRLALGIIFLFVGLSKFFGGYNNSVTYFITLMTPGYLPALLVTIVAAVLPFIEVALGALLLLGVLRNYTIPTSGALFLLFIFGAITIADYELMNRNFVLLLGVIAALYLQEYDHSGLS